MSNNTERYKRRTKEKLALAHVDVIIGAVDWSMNESKEKKHRPFWLQHIHGVTVNDDTAVFKMNLKKLFPSSPEIPRPIKVQEWDGEAAALRYPMKNTYERRISADNGKRFDKKTGENRKCRDTDHQPLKSKDKLELLLHVDSIGIAGRLFLKNVQFMNLKDVGPTFVERQSKARSREMKGKGET